MHDHIEHKTSILRNFYSQPGLAGELRQDFLRFLTSRVFSWSNLAKFIWFSKLVYEFGFGGALCLAMESHALQGEQRSPHACLFVVRTIKYEVHR